MNEQDETGPLTREDIIKAAELITDTFCSIAKNANEILQKPEFMALLAALPEPEPEDERLSKPDPCMSCKHLTESSLNSCSPVACDGCKWPDYMGYEQTEESPLSICPDLLDHATEFFINGYELRKYGREGAGLWSVYDPQDRIYRKVCDGFESFVSGPLRMDGKDEYIRETRFTLSEALRIVEDLKK